MNDEIIIPLAILGASYLIDLSIKLIKHVWSISPIKAYFSNYKKIKSTKHFKEIKI